MTGYLFNVDQHISLNAQLESHPTPGSIVKASAKGRALEFVVVETDGETTTADGGKALRVRVRPHRCAECECLLGSRLFHSESNYPRSSFFCRVCAQDLPDYAKQLADHEQRGTPDHDPMADAVFPSDEPTTPPVDTIAQMASQL
jgi:hypothetical protein